MIDITEQVGYAGTEYEFFWSQPHETVVGYRGGETLFFKSLSKNTEADAVKFATNFMNAAR